MVIFCVHKNLLFHYCFLSPCIVMCKIYLVSAIAILLVFIVSYIGNEQNIVLLNVMINISLFLDVHYLEEPISSGYPAHLGLICFSVLLSVHL